MTKTLRDAVLLRERPRGYRTFAGFCVKSQRHINVWSLVMTLVLRFAVTLCERGYKCQPGGGVGVGSASFLYSIQSKQQHKGKMVTKSIGFYRQGRESPPLPMCVVFRCLAFSKPHIVFMALSLGTVCFVIVVRARKLPQSSRPLHDADALHRPPTET